MKKVIVDTGKSPELWKKGQLHCHTLWSDGRSFPEEAVYRYKSLGYDFVCLSDHNIFQDNDDVWLPLRMDEGHWPPNATLDAYNRVCEIFGNDILATRRLSYRTFVRLSTFKELCARFNEEEKFTLIPGTELTWNFWEEPQILHDIHANAINIAEELLPDDGIPYREALASHYKKYRAAAERTSAVTFFMANHPWWRNWDYLPQDLLDNPEIANFEVCNSGSKESDPECNKIMTPDKFWDVVLAHRLEDGLPVIRATASDDSHFYMPENIGKNGNCSSAWVNVRVPDSLTPDNICRALNSGDYYPTSGVILDTVEYDTDTRELRVVAKAEPGVNYRIEFYATRRGFDRTYTTTALEHPTRKDLSRNMPRYSDEIGRLLKSVDGPEAVCAANADDLYIRAKVISDIPAASQDSASHPLTLTAWTQPVPVM